MRIGQRRNNKDMTINRLERFFTSIKIEYNLK